jgi:hypothetical protein
VFADIWMLILEHHFERETRRLGRAFADGDKGVGRKRCEWAVLQHAAARLANSCVDPESVLRHYLDPMPHETLISGPHRTLT